MQLKSKQHFMKSDRIGLHFQCEHVHRWSLKFWMEMKHTDWVDPAHLPSFTYLANLWPAAEQRQYQLTTHSKRNTHMNIRNGRQWEGFSSQAIYKTHTEAIPLTDHLWPTGSEAASVRSKVIRCPLFYYRLCRDVLGGGFRHLRCSPQTAQICWGDSWSWELTKPFHSVF